MNGLERTLLDVTLASLFIGVVVFLLLREFWTWYWKQSEQVRLLREIAHSLHRLEARTGTLPTEPPPADAPAAPAGAAPAGPRPTGFWGFGDS